ncbi:serine protease [Amylostereum chailletii]|nr:serine protease [Amylostereum chailletii]
MSLIEVHRVPDAETSGRHIVQLKETVSKSGHLQWFDRIRSGNSRITHADWEFNVFHGYAGEFDEDTLNALRASPDVKSIEEDSAVEPEATVSQTNAPWGLSRISQDVRVQGSVSSLTFTYRYDSSAGTGVDIYILDKLDKTANHITDPDEGINTTHVDFGGRARLGAVFGSPDNVDTDGHGTHVAGIAAGTRYGVAKGANLIAVKVLPGSIADVISGLTYVATSVTASGRPSVVNMSLSSGVSPSLDTATDTITARGIHVAAAAGNQNTDASTRSPARVPSVNTVGAIDITDTRRPTSNYGPSVDLFAPGGEIISTGIANSTIAIPMSGTSMASPHVAGLIAYLIIRYGNRTAASMSDLVKQYAVKGAIDPSTLPAGTVNLIARNDI